jgi:hypothetical protein
VILPTFSAPLFPAGPFTLWRKLVAGSSINAMDHTITAVERAFQLAKSGCASISEIKERLKAEGYLVTQISGPVLSTQLRSLIKAARASPSRRRDFDPGPSNVR